MDLLNGKSVYTLYLVKGIISCMAVRGAIHGSFQSLLIVTCQQSHVLLKELLALWNILQHTAFTLVVIATANSSYLTVIIGFVTWTSFH